MSRKRFLIAYGYEVIEGVNVAGGGGAAVLVAVGGKVGITVTPGIVG
jgi:hypothetical protein